MTELYKKNVALTNVALFSAEYFQFLNEEFFNSMNKSSVPPHDLKIKVGQECYIMRNLSPTAVRLIDCTRHSVKAVM